MKFRIGARKGGRWEPFRGGGPSVALGAFEIGLTEMSTSRSNYRRGKRHREGAEQAESPGALELEKGRSSTSYRDREIGKLIRKVRKKEKHASLNDNLM